MAGILLVNLLSAFVWFDVTVLGLPVLIWCALAAGAYYVYAFFFKKRLLTALKTNLFLTFFVVQGLVWLGLSYLGMAGWSPLSCRFPTSLSYAPRQAYYLAFLPLVVVPSLLGDGQAAYAFLKKYGLLAAAAYWLFASHFAGGVNAFSVSPQSLYLLLALCLFSDRRDPFAWALAAFLWLLPSGGTGDSSVLLLRLLFTGLFLLGDRAWVQRLSIIVLPCILVVSLALPLIRPLVNYIDKDSGLDATVGFRAAIWADEDRALVDSHGVGVGFGTTYASDELVADVWPAELGANDEYTAAQRPFVTAPHSSFVAVAFRQGLIGLALFSGLFVSLWRRIRRHALAAERPQLLFLLLGAMLLFSVNVGLESPQYFEVFLLAFGWLFLRLYGRPKAAAQGVDKGKSEGESENAA